MKIQVVQSDQEFDALGKAWNTLYQHSAIRVPFLHFSYLRGWWETRGGGEWQTAELYILTAWDDEGALVGIAPMFRTEDSGRGRRLMLLGSIEVSDMLDLIVKPEDLPVFLAAVCDHLDGRDADQWDSLEWFNIPEISPTLPLLQAEAEQRGWVINQLQYLPSPYIPLAADWETYLAGIAKKQRHEIRRKIRRMESFEQPVRWFFVEHADELDAAVEAFLELMAADPIKAAFLSTTMRSYMQKTIHTAFKEGWLKLAFLEIDGKNAAAYLSFDDGNCIYLYNSGISLEYRELSPGWVLLAYVIQWAIENGRTEFDFLRGDEEYKYRFGGENRWVMQIQVWKPR